MISPQERFEAFVNNLTNSSNSKLVLNFRLNLPVFQDSKEAAKIQGKNSKFYSENFSPKDSVLNQGFD